MTYIRFPIDFSLLNVEERREQQREWVEEGRRGIIYPSSSLCVREGKGERHSSCAHFLPLFALKRREGREEEEREKFGRE